jgi:hypothetical protein
MTLILNPDDYLENLPSELNPLTLGVNMPKHINPDLYEIILFVDATDINNPTEILIKG